MSGFHYESKIKKYFSFIFAYKVFGFILYSKLEHNMYLPYSGKNILYPSLAVTAVDDETYFHTFPLCVCMIIQNYSPGVIPVPQSSLVGHCANVLIITKPDVFLFYILYL